MTEQPRRLSHNQIERLSLFQHNRTREGKVLDCTCLAVLLVLKYNMAEILNTQSGYDEATVSIFNYRPFITLHYT